MGLFNNFPYLDLSNLNLDFILKETRHLKDYKEIAEASAATAEEAKNTAVQAAESAAEDAETASTSAESAQDYAEHIADPVGGLVTTWLDDNITPTTPPVDASLTIQGAAADAKATGDAINTLAVQVANGIPLEVKVAIDTIVQNAAFKNDGDYTAAKATIHTWATNVSVLALNAVFNSGSDTIYTDDSLEDLKPYLTVTALYDDGTSAEITTYTLSGTLEAGQNTITVSYAGATTTFTVTAVAPLYTMPDVALTNVSGDGRSGSIKVENGLITFTGSFYSTIYIDENGNVTTTQPQGSAWFSVAAGTHFINQAIDIDWSAGSGSNQAMDFKWANADASGNLATASMTVNSSSSGSDGEALFDNPSYATERNFSAFAFQWKNNSTAGGSVSFRMRMYVDGVRYF